MRILTYCATYLPGYKAGGPLRTIAGLVRRLGPEFEFWVLTRDHDKGDSAPYPDVKLSEWTEHGGARVYYAPERELTLAGVRRIAASARPDLHYVNGFFAPTFAMLPVAFKSVRLLAPAPMILAPRGEFSLGALEIKSRRKTAVLSVLRRLPGYKAVTWQASAEPEAEDIRRQFPEARVVIAGDLTDPPRPPTDARGPKIPGRISLAYVSRVTPKKNLALAIRLLGRVKGDVDYHVYGPFDEPAYAARCREEAARLPPNVRVEFHGDVPHATVVTELARHHAFLMPTMGENFGHAILEALLAGCVTIIGDQTPWAGLAARGAGWDLPVTDEDGFVRAIQRVIDMDAPTFALASDRAREVGIERAADEAIVEQNRALFRGALRAG
jgi:glycosyltransferase involved in cell wall biosynthesis